MADLVYDSFKLALLNADIDFENDDIRAVLVTSSYTPSAAHDTYSDITNQVTGDGYTAGGKSLTNPTTAIVSNKAVFDAEDVLWEESTITARAIVLYKYVDDGGSPDASSPLIMYWDSGFGGGNKSSEDGDFKITWGSDGIFRIDVAA